MILNFQINFFMKILLANRIAPDGTPRSAASHLGLYCLPMPIKRTPVLNELMTSQVLWSIPEDSHHKSIIRTKSSKVLLFKYGHDTLKDHEL